MTRYRKVTGKAGFVTGIIQESENDRADSLSGADKSQSAYQFRTDSAEASDRDLARQARIDFDRDRRMTNHLQPLAFTKAKPRPEPEPQRTDSGVSDSAQRRMGNHRRPLTFSKK